MDTTTLLPEAPPRNLFCQAAQAYLSRGWCPIPVERNGKRPLGKDWPALRLTATEAATTWDTETPPNVGLLCGEPSKLVILDFDDPAEYARWAEAHPNAAKTRRVARDNAEPGRCHLYFALSEGQTAPPSAKGPGWDLLSTGRQAVAPPSRHPSGGTYRVVNNAPALPWKPEYRPALPQAPANPTDGTTAAGAPTAYIGKALQEECRAVAGAPEGGRNDALNSAAVKLGHWVGGGALARADAESMLLDAARAAGLPEAEARATIRSGLQAGERDPKTPPTPFQKREGVRPVLTAPEPPPQAPEPWTEPAPLSGTAGELPPWPWEALPCALADMGQAVAAAMGVHESMAGAAVLGCASIAVGNRVLLTIKGGGAPHTCRANTYWLVAAPVGSGKTPTLRPCLAPLQEWEAERLPAFKLALARWKAADAVAEARRAVLKRDAQAAAKAQEDTRDIEHRLAMLEAEAEAEPAEPRLYVEDTTSEALGRRLVGNAERMGVVSSEGRKVLRIAMGRYTAGAGGDYDLWLAGHAGDPHRVDRQGRPPYDLQAPCLSALLFVQPDALQAAGADPEARACGFLARFLYLVPPGGAAGAYPRDTVPEPVAAAYRRTIRAILELPTRTDPDGAPCPRPAALLPEAFDLWTDLYLGWGGELNAAAGVGNLFLAQWLAKCREHGARLALLFAVVETVSAGGPWPGVLHVGMDTMANAARVCEHLQIHARRAAGLIGESQEIADARRVWAWIAANRPKLAELRQGEGCGPVAAVKPRDLMQAGVAGCDTAEAAGRVLRALEARGYLQAVLWQRPGAAARPHELWYVHPTAEGAPHGR